MGKVISHQKYEFYEYLTACLISLGMILFLSGSGDSVQAVNDPSTAVTATGISGLVILISYMVFDSFTSNWQSQLFQTYKMSSVRMMAGVNLFSCLLTGVSLIQQGTLEMSFYFMLNVSDHYFLLILERLFMFPLFWIAQGLPDGLRNPFILFCHWSAVHLLHNWEIRRCDFHHDYDHPTGMELLLL